MRMTVDIHIHPFMDQADADADADADDQAEWACLIDQDWLICVYWLAQNCGMNSWAGWEHLLKRSTY